MRAGSEPLPIGTLNGFGDQPVFNIINGNLLEDTCSVTIFLHGILFALDRAGGIQFEQHRSIASSDKTNASIILVVPPESRHVQSGFPAHEYCQDSQRQVKGINRQTENPVICLAACGKEFQKVIHQDRDIFATIF